LNLRELVSALVLSFDVQIVVLPVLAVVFEGVTCLPLSTRLRAYHEFNCIEYMAVRQLLHTKQQWGDNHRRNVDSRTTTMSSASGDGANADEMVKRDASLPARSNHSATPRSTEIDSARSLAASESSVLPTPETTVDSELTHPGETVDSGHTDKDVDEEAPGRHLQLEKGLLWFRAEQTQLLTEQDLVTAMLKLKRINDYVDSVDGKSYGFKFMDLFAARHLPTVAPSATVPSNATPTQTLSSSPSISDSASGYSVFISESLTGAYKMLNNLWSPVSQSSPTLPSPDVPSTTTGQVLNGRVT
jgi:hypothetical protein